MLISPELLNMHKNVSWQGEFGLDIHQLRASIVQIVSPLLDITNGDSVKVVLFEDRQAAYVNAGKQSLPNPTLNSLKMIFTSKRQYQIIEKQQNAHFFKHLSDRDNSERIQACGLGIIRNKEENVSGYICLYAQEFSLENAAIEKLLEIINGSIVNYLLAAKYKRLERDRDEFNELVANTNAHPIFAKDKQSRLVFANRAFVNFYPPEKRDKIIGYTTVEDYPVDQRELFLADDQDAFAMGEKRVIENIDFPSGESTVLETIKRTFKTSSGQEYILGVAYDLTQQYALIDQLKKKNKDLDQVATMLATDVRAPANAMVKLINWLLQDLKDHNNPDVKENLFEVSKRANKLSKLLSAIYQYCFAGRDHHVNTQISLNELFSEIMSDILAKSKTDKTLQTNVDEQTVVLPRGPLRQVLQELLKNALEHSSEDNLTLDVNCWDDHTCVFISVTDNNKQISEDIKDQMFLLFESGKNESQDEVKGLGLAIARKIVESYRGKLTLEQGNSEGNTFVIQWPKKTASKTS